MAGDDSGSSSDKPPSLQDRLAGIFGHGQESLSRRVKEFDARRTLDAVLDAPKSFQREWQKHGATGVLTKFPVAMILICLLASSFFAYHSGFVDGTSIKPGDDPSLNVNGDLEVYLPDGSPVKETIDRVEDNWSTNVMIIYIDSPDSKIDDRRILIEMAYVENRLNPRVSDPSDDVIYAFSLSTVIKEVNSSAPRVREAVITELAASICPDDNETCIAATTAVLINEYAENLDPVMGTYDIPSQERVDTIMDQMYDDEGNPTPGLDKLARDTDDDGNLDRAVIIIAVAENDDKPVKEIITETQELLDDIAK